MGLLEECKGHELEGRALCAALYNRRLGHIPHLVKASCVLGIQNSSLEATMKQTKTLKSCTALPHSRSSAFDNDKDRAVALNWPLLCDTGWQYIVHVRRLR